MELLAAYRDARRDEGVARLRRLLALRAMAATGMSQREIADALGVTQPAVSQQLKAARGLDAVDPELLVEAAGPVLTVWAAERETAIKRLHRALSEFQVRGVATTLTLFRALVEMEVFRAAEFHTGFLDQLLTSGDLEKLHSQQDPEAEQAAMMAAACLATISAARLPDDLFAHGDESSWWFEGTRLLHGRFPR